MPKVRTTITIDEDVLKAAKVRAARQGKRDGEVIEAALRRELGLDLFDRLWARNDLSEKEAMDLALEAQRSARRSRRR
jgi:Arc/MetJ family transcription regulator